MIMKAWKNFKIKDKKLIFGVTGLAVLMTVVIFTVLMVHASFDSTKKASYEQSPTSKQEPVSSKKSSSTKASTDPAQPETPSTNTAPSPTPAQQGSSGYSPDYIKSMPPSATATLRGLQVSAARIDHNCVLTMQATVQATGLDASGEVHFSVTNSQINPPETNIYSGFFTVPKDQTMQVVKSTGPLVTWVYSTQLQVSASVIGARGTAVGAPSGQNAVTVTCPYA